MSKQIEVLGSGDRRVVLLLETHVSGREVDRRVLATDIKADLGLLSCVWERIGWPDCPTQSEVAHGFSLIPVSGVGEAVGGVSEAVGDEKIGGNGVEGTFNKDMTNDGMTFETHKQIVKPLSQTCNHIWRVRTCGTRRSARVCVRWGVICARSVAVMAVAAVGTRNCQKEQTSEKRARPRMESGFWVDLTTIETFSLSRLRTSLLVLVCAWL